MQTLHTPCKDDFFEARLEPKPRQNLVQLTQAVESIGQEIAECDQEIQRWQGKKSYIKNKCINIVNAVKSAI